MVAKLGQCIDKSEEYLKLKKDFKSKYYYQIQLGKDIKNKLLDSKKTSGMLVLPTGGGKTRIAVTSAIDIALKDGYKILWIAHRHMLLEQAAKTFCEFSNLSDEKISIRMISGKHDEIVSIDKNDNVIIIGNLSMGVREKFDSIAKQTLKNRVFIKDQKWLVIVDEAHHALAKSYKEWIGIETHGKAGWLRKYRKDNIKILGLTATPNFIVENRISPYDENRTRELSALFDDNMIGSISTQKLIDDEILSRPNFITIDTNLDFDAEELLSKVENIKPSLKDSWLENCLNEKIAAHEERNQLIVKTYMNGYENVDFKKSPTLVFASNIINAMVLKAAFAKNGINVDVIYSGNPKNDEIIESFKDKRIQVLINVQILTEGSDIPEIGNVFISKIINSKVLYRQMVGRGLRGVGSGGTETANIVTFKDNIKNHHENFFNVQELNSGLYDDEEFEKIENIDERDMIPFSDDDILKVYEKFSGLLDGDQDIPLIAAIPIGYYNLEERDKKIQVYEHQEDSYKNFITNVEENNAILKKNADDIKKEYFQSANMLFDVSKNDIEELMCYISDITIPEFITHEFKNNLMKELNDIASRSTDFLVWEEHYDKSNYAKSFYSIEEYIEECSRVSRNLRYGLKPLKTVKIENDAPLNYQFDATEHDKNKIFKSASAKICKVLGKDKLEFSPDGFEWSKQAYKSYWGVASTSVADGMSERIKKKDITKIVINKQLQLKGLSSEVIEFVVYHELLHTEMPNYSHDEKFKELEAKFPNFAYCEHMLYKLAHANIENLSDCLVTKKKNKIGYSWELYNKDKKSNGTIDKYINKKGVKLPTLKEMEELYKDEEFRESLLKDDKQWFLCSDKKTSFCFGDGSNGVIDGFNFKKSGKKRTNNLHLLVMEES